MLLCVPPYKNSSEKCPQTIVVTHQWMNNKPVVLQISLIAILKKHHWDYFCQQACEVYIMVMHHQKKYYIF